MDNSGYDYLRTPGFDNISLYKIITSEEVFADGADEGWIQDPRLTARELAMVQLMADITDICHWEESVFDTEIITVWKMRAVADELISEKAWEWCLAELRDKAVVLRETGRIPVMNTGSCVCKFDGVTSALREEVMRGVDAAFGAGSKGVSKGIPTNTSQITTLVNPSMFPLMRGKTLVLKYGGTVDLDDIFASCRNCEISLPHSEVPMTSNMLQRISHGGSTFTKGDHPNTIDPFRWSTRFQWLPCEVSFKEMSDKNNTVRITSYINNLDPSTNSSLYHSIERLISLSLEPWNDCLLLGSQKGRVPMRIRTYGAGPGFKGPWCTCGDDDLCGCPIHPEPGTAYSYEDWKSGLTGKAIVRRTDHARPERAAAIPPDPDHKFYNVSLQEEFREQGLQVIVKISSIELDPSQPRYEGSDWILEGQKNEHIVATAAFYYDVQNITPSSLSFRQETCMDPIDYVFRSFATEDLAEVFGVPTSIHRTEDDPMLVPSTQTIGSVKTPQGRLIAWPNALQHRLEPFELLDKSRSGHRRCVVLYLVDPHYRICSTRNVPPQQHDWWAAAALSPTNFPRNSVAHNLPEEVKDLILKETGYWPMGVSEATNVCAEVEKDRKRAFEAIMVLKPHFDFYDEAWAPW